MSRSDFSNSGSSSTTSRRSRCGTNGCDRRLIGHDRDCGGGGEAQTDKGSFADRTFDFDFGSVPLSDAIHHRQAQPGAAFALGGEERLQATQARLLVHAYAVIDNFDSDVTICEPVAARTVVVRNVIAPSAGRASTALKIRLMSASRISLRPP